jgi:imidazolonepropionase-like amidohydrolase
MVSISRLILACAFVAVGICGCTTTSAPAAHVPVQGAALAADVAIVGATVIDGTGAAPLPAMTLLLRGDRIVAMGPSGEVAVPAGAQVIDATGKTVMPGLADMHVHFSFGAPAQRQADETRQVLARQLYYGVTSILQLGATDGSTDSIRALRAQREAGTLAAPHIYSSGGHLTLPGTHPVYTIFPPAAREAADTITAATPMDEPVNLYPMGLGISFVRNEASARKAVAERAAGGMEVVKITVESGPLAFGDTHPLMSVDMIRTIVDEAGKHELPVFAHVSSPAELQASLEGGAAGVVHAVIDRPLPSVATADRMAKRGFHVVPTLTLNDGAVRFATEPGYMDDPFFRASVTDAELAALRAPGFAGAYREGWVRNANDPARDPLDALKQHRADVLANVGMLHARGVPIAVGTDTGNPYVYPGYSVHRELELLVQAGLSPMEAIVAGTRRGAEMLGQQDEFGTLAVGKRADLLILGADPLDDIRNTRKIEAVIVDGKLVDRASLLPARNEP